MQPEVENTTTVRRPRFLLVAYSCQPFRGSEPGIGWHRALQAARVADTWVICRQEDSQEKIEEYFHEYPPVEGLKFVYLPHSPTESRIRQRSLLGYIAYNRWQRRALALARELHAQHQFHLVHQVNFGTFREPGYTWKLDIPFVWGPIGGTQNYPAQFLAGAGWNVAVREGTRTLVNRFQLHTSRRVKQAARRANALVATNSDAVRDFQRVLGCDSIRLLDSGVEALRPPRDVPQQLDRPLRLLWCGVLEPRKALELLLEAIAILPEGIHVELRVLGKGKMLNKWRRLARKRGIENQVEFAGEVPHEACLAAYEWADAFAFSSLRDNSATVNSEALASGLPIICLDHQGVGDMVDESCGIKVPLTNRRDAALGFRDAIVRLATEPDLRKLLSAGAYERAKKFLWHNNGNEMLQIYEQVLRDAGHAFDLCDDQATPTEINGSLPNAKVKQSQHVDSNN